MYNVHMCDTRPMCVCVQMTIDNTTTAVHSDIQVTPGNTSFKRDLILSPNASYLYALTDQEVSFKHCFRLDLYVVLLP